MAVYLVVRKNIMLLKETLKEINRLKSNYSVNSSIYTLLKGHRLLLLIRNGHVAIALNPCTKHVAIAPNPCTKQHRNESCEYAICELTNPQSYYGENPRSRMSCLVISVMNLALCRTHRKKISSRLRRLPLIKLSRNARETFCFTHSEDDFVQDASRFQPGSREKVSQVPLGA